jgi:hypothetical protein
MTDPRNQLDPDIRYWRERCAELQEDNHSLREQLQAHVVALHKARMTISDGDLVSLDDEEEQ